MEERKIIEERLRKKEGEIEALEERLHSARVYVQALQDVLKLLNKGVSVSVLKEGSGVARAREIILAARAPVHITSIIEAMGKNVSREARASLTSSLAAYVRRGEIFTRPAPNTFGLTELGHSSTEEEEEEGPPAGFGQMSAAEPTRATSAMSSAVRPIVKAIPSPSASSEADLDDDIPF